MVEAALGALVAFGAFGALGALVDEGDLDDSGALGALGALGAFGALIAGGAVGGSSRPEKEKVFVHTGPESVSDSSPNMSASIAFNAASSDVQDDG